MKDLVFNKEEEEGMTIKDDWLFLLKGGTCFHSPKPSNPVYLRKSQPPINSFHK